MDADSNFIFWQCLIWADFQCPINYPPLALGCCTSDGQSWAHVARTTRRFYKGAMNMLELCHRFYPNLPKPDKIDLGTQQLSFSNLWCFIWWEFWFWVTFLKLLDCSRPMYSGWHQNLVNDNQRNSSPGWLQRILCLKLFPWVTFIHIPKTMKSMNINGFLHRQAYFLNW